MPLMSLVARRFQPRLLALGIGLALCACGPQTDRHENIADTVSTNALEDPVGAAEANAIAADNMQTSAQSAALTEASPEETADAGGAVR